MKINGELIEKNASIIAVKIVKDHAIPEPNGQVTLNYLISDQGGQGDVYHVTYRGRDYAMKWYCKEDEDVIGGAQYRTIVTIHGEENKPCDKFIWPLIIVTEPDPKEGKRFGYLMDLIPQDYSEMEYFLWNDGTKKAVRFKSYNAVLHAAMDIVFAMRKLHLKGWSYKDLNPKNFAINPVTGHVLVVDNDNVSVDTSPCTVKGTMGYMAPEIPRSRYKKSPDRKTDYYSLAIILYRLFFVDHPMKGAAWEEVQYYETDEVEEYFYAFKPVFHFDPNNDSNRPTQYNAPHALSRWYVYPQELRALFTTALTEGIRNPEKRPPENTWLNTLSKVKDRLIRLGGGREHFVNFNDPETIPPGCLGMKVGMNMVAIYPQKGIYEISITGNVQNYENLVAGIDYDKQKGTLTIRNMTEKVWWCRSPKTKQDTCLKKGESYPVSPGVQIAFGPNMVGVIFEVKKR